MKKISLFLCFILILGLIGCNNSPDADNSRAEAEASSREEESSQPPVEESSVPEDSASDTDPVLSAYRGIIADLTQEYGEKHDGEFCVFGLVMAKLVDFDNDGVPELLCSYSPKGVTEKDVTPYQVSIYGYKDGAAVELYTGPSSNSGSSVNPRLCLLLKDGQYYYASLSLELKEYLVLSDGEFSVAFSAYKSFPPETYKINGEPVSESEYETQCNAFLEGSTLECYSYYTKDSGLILDGQIPVGIEEELSELPVEESSVPEDSASDADPILSAYRGIIADLTQKYGEKQDGKYFVFGLVMAKLVDFDNDGVPELLCSYSSNEDGSYQVSIYGYKDGAVIDLYTGPCSNFGSGVKPGLWLLLKDGQYYYVSISLETTEYWVLSDGEFSVAFSAFKNFPPDTYKINGEPVSESEYETQCNAFLEGGTLERYIYYTKDSGLLADGHIYVDVDVI